MEGADKWISFSVRAVVVLLWYLGMMVDSFCGKGCFVLGWKKNIKISAWFSGESYRSYGWLKKCKNSWKFFSHAFGAWRLNCPLSSGNPVEGKCDPFLVLIWVQKALKIKMFNLCKTETLTQILKPLFVSAGMWENPFSCPACQILISVIRFICGFIDMLS